MHSEAPAGSVVVRFRLRLGPGRLESEALLPEGPARISDLLPAIQPLANAVVRAAQEEAVAGGGPAVSCRAGCGACCRQPVPIAESEAVRLLDWIARQPAPRRRALEARFDAAHERLAEAGLLDRLCDLGAIDDVAERQALGRRYFDLGIACPFLEEESCSIHPDRPLACREYLVTSPSEHCADPSPEHVELVPMPVRPSITLFRLREGELRDEPSSLLLVLAPEWRRAHPRADAAAGLGPSLFEAFVRGLAAGAA